MAYFEHQKFLLDGQFCISMENGCKTTVVLVVEISPRRYNSHSALEDLLEKYPAKPSSTLFACCVWLHSSVIRFLITFLKHLHPCINV